MILWSLAVTHLLHEENSSLVAQTLAGSRWSSETQITVCKCKKPQWAKGSVLCFPSSTKHCTLTLFTDSVYYSALFFSLSSLCGAFGAVLTLSPSWRRPLPVLLGLIYRYMPGFTCVWLIQSERGDLCDEVRSLRMRVSVRLIPMLQIAQGVMCVNCTEHNILKGVALARCVCVSQLLWSLGLVVLFFLGTRLIFKVAGLHGVLL